MKDVNSVVQIKQLVGKEVKEAKVFRDSSNNLVILITTTDGVNYHFWFDIPYVDSEAGIAIISDNNSIIFDKYLSELE